MSNFLYIIVYDHLPEHAPISTNQWGSLPGRSTTDVFLSATHDWHQTLDNGSKVCATIFDLHAGSINFDSACASSLSYCKTA